MSADTLQPEANTRLQGKALFLARTGWAIFAASCLGFLSTSVILYSGIFFQPGLPWIEGSPSIPELIPLWWIFKFLFYAVLPVFIFWRRSDDKMALLVSATLLAVGASSVPPGFWENEMPLWLEISWGFLGWASNPYVTFVLFLVVLSFFPDGRFVLKRASVILGALISTLICALLWPSLGFGAIIIGLFVLPFSTLITAQVYRYRYISSPSQRQQTKWVVYGLIITALLVVLIVFLAPMAGLGWPYIYRYVRWYSVLFMSFVLPLVIPACLSISIFRYRLWGIDFLINRSLVYGLLSLLLAFVFAGTLYITSFITQGQSSFLTFGMAAVVAGALFQPTRTTLQRFIDRHFYNIYVDYQKQPAAKNTSQVLKQTRFGDYQGLELIGRGGMAEVYKSIHPVLKTPIAIKILPASLATDPEFRNRFIREAEIVSKLEHPNIVRVFDYGEQDDTHYMVMEYLAGKDLGKLLRAHGRLPLVQALPIIQHIADALDYAHSSGLVHRDIKPSNVMLDDPGLLAKLTDFGIAKLIGRTAMTHSGTMLGTFDYMAPEQIQASTDVDARADVYALGVMVYQMLAGELPFKYNNPGALLIAHLNQPPPDPCEIVPDLPNYISRAIQRAMAKIPAERFATAGEFVAALNGKLN